MVVVPAGSFMMGGGALEGYDYEYPRHRVTIANPFAVGKFTVTFAEWDACVAGGGCDGYLPDDWGWGRGRRPVITVSWRNAQSYVAWLKRTSGKEYRLLSEAEWEYAARGGRDTPFWWGATITPGQANYSGTIYNFDATFPFQNGGKGEYRKKTLPVDSFQPNPFGLYQVHGNVAQWVRDCWVDNYNGAPNDGSERITSDCRSLVLRGGSWQSYYWQVRAASRNSHSPDSQMSTVGFRVARKLNP
jgi:formylglycine-generating enzyme required for sulfatase activity